MTADFSFDPAKSGIEVSATTRMPRTTALEDRRNSQRRVATRRRSQSSKLSMRSLATLNPVGG
jgi:hypothetical protein